MLPKYHVDAPTAPITTACSDEIRAPPCLRALDALPQYLPVLHIYLPVFYVEDPFPTSLGHLPTQESSLQPCLQIDWKTYMQQVEAVSRGERDYSRIAGDTGPIAYGGGHVAFFSVLRLLTGGSVVAGQVVFAAMYVLSQAIALWTCVHRCDCAHACSRHPQQPVPSCTPNSLPLPLPHIYIPPSPTPRPPSPAPSAVKSSLRGHSLSCAFPDERTPSTSSASSMTLSSPSSPTSPSLFSSRGGSAQPSSYSLL